MADSASTPSPKAPPFTRRWLYGVLPAFVGLLLALGVWSWEDYSDPWFWGVAAGSALVISVATIAVTSLLNAAPAHTPEASLASEPLLTERLPCGKRRLTRNLTVDFQGDRITVPSGTETDYSTIPFFGRFVVRWSQVDVAGVVHDWLYRVGEVDGKPISRAYADEVWYACARSGSSRANPLQAWVCWLSLHFGAKGIWKAARKAATTGVDGHAPE